jgi:hypothetical protein
MAVYKSSPINFAKISDEMSWVAERWMNAEIEIIDPNLKDLDWDEWTNTSKGESIVLWSGKARVQQVAYETGTPENGRAVLANRRVSFQVPRDEVRPFIRSGLTIRVTDGGEFPGLENIDFMVISSINSSYAWLTSIECKADLKSEMDDGE